jgi:hypothetical protein
MVRIIFMSGRGAPGPVSRNYVEACNMPLKTAAAQYSMWAGMRASGYEIIIIIQ